MVRHHRALNSGVLSFQLVVGKPYHRNHKAPPFYPCVISASTEQMPNAKGKGKGKATRTSASTACGKNNVFGVLVNRVQAEQLENAKAEEIKQQASAGPSKTGTTCRQDNITRDEAETEPVFVGTHQGLPVKEANSKLKYIRL